MNVKKIIRKISAMIIVIPLLCNFALGKIGVFEVVPAQRIPDVLNTISTCVHQNFLKINSWEGETDVSWYTEYKGKEAKRIFESRTGAVGDPPNRIAELMESTTKFSSDFGKDLFYVKVLRKNLSRYVDLVGNRDLGTNSIPWWRISISTPDYYMESTPNRIRDGQVVQRRAVKENIDKECSSCERLPVVDTLDLFDAGTPVWLTYSHILERIKEKGEYVVDGKYALKVEQRVLDGDLQYRIHEPAKVGPEGDNIWLIKTYSTNAGWNMISSERRRANGELVSRQTLEYQSVQSVYILSSTTYETLDPNDGSLTYQKKKTYKNIRLNHSIPEEIFTYKNLGIEEGDMFIDKIENKEYTYQGGELVEVEKTKK